MGASGLSLTLGSCGREEARTLYSRLNPIEDMIPGIPNWYASVCRECPAGCGLLVKNREGRSIKLEGNPSHPVNRGALCARGQAALQGLYHPDRIRGPFRRGGDGDVESISWEAGIEDLAGRLGGVIEAGRGEAIAFLGSLEGFTLHGLTGAWFESIGSHHIIVHEPFDHAPLLRANEITFGIRDIPEYDFTRASLLLSFGADFLETWLSPVEFSRMFSKMHDPAGDVSGVHLFFGPRMSLTASNADSFFAVRPGHEIDIALSLVHVILMNGWARDLRPDDITGLKEIVADFSPDVVEGKTGLKPQLIVDIAHSFSHRPSLAIGGGIEVRHSRSTLSNVAINLLNYVSGNFGQTISFGRSSSFTEVNPYRDVRELIESMRNGNVEILFIHEVDPSSTLPSSSGWDDALDKVHTVVSLTPFLNKTSSLADYVLPVSTPLESWGDYSPREGIHGLVQPAMVPLFDTRMAGDIFLSIGREIDIPVSEEERGFEGYLMDNWRRVFGPFPTDQEFELFWEESMRRGGYWDEEGDGGVKPTLGAEVFSLDWPGSRSNEGDPLLAVPFPTLALYDGRVANRPWLRELPDPVSQIAWDPWIEVHPETVKGLGIESDEIIEFLGAGNAESAVVRITDDIVRGIIAVPLGDRGTAGESNAFIFPEREIEALSGGLVWVSSGVRIAGSGRIERVPRVQASFIDNGRGVVGYTTVEALNTGRDRKTGVSGERGVDMEVSQMYADHEHPGHRWGMAIDLSLCTGCSACVVACYAENNIPIAGRDGVLAGREMSWIRVERYNVMVGGSKRMFYLPMMCQQCDSAPCEPVCPVFATYHNPEGLNAQVYNRCIGTRYCSNNCPYKVRRFNWFSYSWREPLNIQLNPDVTVREKGVMEKCTFCVQRIRYARDKARDERRSIEDGEIIPACAQTCPTGAIVFGDLNDPESLVSRISGKDTGYRVLERLNTRPAVTYLKRVFREDWKT